MVFANKDIDLVKDVKVEEIFSISPVHKLIFFKVQLTIERKQKKMIKFRSKKNFNSELLLDTIYNGISYGRVAACPHGAESKEKCLTCLDDLFNSVAKERYEEMCPIIEKEIVIVNSAPWYNEVVDRAKKQKKSKERQWRRCKTEVSRLEYTRARNDMKKIIDVRKREYYQNRTVQAAGNVNKLYKILDNITGRKNVIGCPRVFQMINLQMTSFDSLMQRL